MFEEVPCIAGFINYVVVVVEDGDREFVAAQIFPDVFDRIEFRSVGWQAHEGDVFGDRKRGSNMIAGAVEDESGVAYLPPPCGRSQWDAATWSRRSPPA
jgi:hypothetical protein